MCLEKRRNQIGRALLLGTAGVMAAGLLAAQLSAQSFVLSQNGKSVGTGSLTWNKTGAGFEASSQTKIDMPGLKYSFTENASLDAGYHLGKAQLSGAVNGTSATVNTARQGQQFMMKINASSQVINTPLAFHPQAIFFPDFDPAALQTVVNLGAAHNNRDLWALVPKQSGSVTALRIVTNADMQGTLNGNPLTVHHLTVAYDTNKIEVFASPANVFLQAEWTDEGFAMVRQGFKLTPPARPPMPPPAQPPAQSPAAQPPAAQPQDQAPAAQPGQQPGQAPQPQ
jgi:hypothetical protein